MTPSHVYSLIIETEEVLIQALLDRKQVEVLIQDLASWLKAEESERG